MGKRDPSLHPGCYASYRLSPGKAEPVAGEMYTEGIHLNMHSVKYWLVAAISVSRYVRLILISKVSPYLLGLLTLFGFPAVVSSTLGV